MSPSPAVTRRRRPERHVRLLPRWRGRQTPDRAPPPAREIVLPDPSSDLLRCLRYGHCLTCPLINAVDGEIVTVAFRSGRRHETTGGGCWIAIGSRTSSCRRLECIPLMANAAEIHRAGEAIHGHEISATIGRGDEQLLGRDAPEYPGTRGRRVGGAALNGNQHVATPHAVPRCRDRNHIDNASHRHRGP